MKTKFPIFYQDLILPQNFNYLIWLRSFNWYRNYFNESQQLLKAISSPFYNLCRELTHPSTVYTGMQGRRARLSLLRNTYQQRGLARFVRKPFRALTTYTNVLHPSLTWGPNSLEVKENFYLLGAPKPQLCYHPLKRLTPSLVNSFKVGRKPSNRWKGVRTRSLVRLLAKVNIFTRLLIPTNWAVRIRKLAKIYFPRKKPYSFLGLKRLNAHIQTPLNKFLWAKFLHNKSSPMQYSTYEPVEDRLNATLRTSRSGLTQARNLWRRWLEQGVKGLKPLKTFPLRGLNQYFTRGLSLELTPLSVAQPFNAGIRYIRPNWGFPTMSNLPLDSTVPAVKPSRESLTTLKLRKVQFRTYSRKKFFEYKLVQRVLTRHLRAIFVNFPLPRIFIKRVNRKAPRQVFCIFTSRLFGTITTSLGLGALTLSQLSTATVMNHTLVSGLKFFIKRLARRTNSYKVKKVRRLSRHLKRLQRLNVMRLLQEGSVKLRLEANDSGLASPLTDPQFSKISTVSLSSFLSKPLTYFQSCRPIPLPMGSISFTKIYPKHINYSFIPTLGSTLMLKPLHSLTLSSSPFMFLTYITTSFSRSTDILKSTHAHYPYFKYSVFPDSDNIKASVFRRLNRQKLLFQSRIHTTSAHLTPITRETSFVSSSQLLHPELTTLSNKGGSPLSIGFEPTYNKKWIFNTLSSLVKRTRAASITPRIRRIRFKPGYSRLWRTARRSIKDILNISLRYQYRLTPKLHRKYFLLRRSRLSHTSLTIGFSLLTSRLIFDNWSLSSLFSSDNVYLNGYVCHNTNTRLFVTDFIQLVLNIKFYVVLRWIRTWSSKRKFRATRIFFQKVRPTRSVNFSKTPKMSKNLPYWFFDLQYTYGDIPKYFEVDYFSLSIFLIHDHITMERWLPTRSFKYNPLTLNMYNWKYIT